MAFIPTFDESRRYYESRLNVSLPARDKVQVRCPFHDDQTPSMSIDLKAGTWFCHTCNIGGGILAFEQQFTGKEVPECWTAINATIGREDIDASKQRREPVAKYDYLDAAGNVAFQVDRYADPKGFSQRRPNGKGGWIGNMNGVTRVPFNLPAVVRSNVVLVAEGEKDALNLQRAAADFSDDGGKLCYAATTNPGGAGKWLDSYSPFCAGKRIFVFPDNDDAGRKHAQQVCTSASKYAQGVHLVELPGLAEHGDVNDYLKDHTPDDLFKLMQKAPPWVPPAGAPGITIPAGALVDGGFKLIGIGELLSRPEVPVD
jgi:hypothetical protein